MRADEFNKQQEEQEQRLAKEFSELPDAMRQALLLSYEIRAKIAYHKRMVSSLEFDYNLLCEGKPLDWGTDDVQKENTPIT